MTTTPPGWYDDGSGSMRWWDGGQWTEHVAPPVAAPVAGATSEPAPSAAETLPLPDLYPAPASAFVPAAQQPGSKQPGSKLWIVWIVLGVVVLTTIVATVVFVVQLVGAAALAGQPSDVTPGDSDEQAAVATVELYDDAWQDVDCDAYLASTTENFRTQARLPDCEAFESEAEAFDEAVEDYEVTVTDVRSDGGDILVSTTETYTYLLDEDGEPLDDPTAESDEWVYVVVSEDGSWVIDEMQ